MTCNMKEKKEEKRVILYNIVGSPGVIHTLNRILRLRRLGGCGGAVKGLSHRRPIGLPNTSTKLSDLHNDTSFKPF